MIRVFILVIILISITSCGNPKKYSNVLNIAITDKIPTLDPADSYDTISGKVMAQSYETLYQYHYLKRPFTLIPLLAKGMPVVERSGTRYIIKIKKNIRYHNNPSFKNKPRFVEAQDFINQIKRLAYIPTNSNGLWLFNDKIKGFNKFRKDVQNNFNKFLTTNIDGLKAPDKHTLIIDLIRPYPQMLYALAISFTSPIPIETIKYYNNNLSRIMVGTGPFMLSSWIPGKRMVLNRFKHFHKEYYPYQGDRKAVLQGLLDDAGKLLPFVDKINFHVIRESKKRWDLFSNKMIDYVTSPQNNYKSLLGTPNEIIKNVRNKKINLQIFPTLTYWWIAFNMKDPIVGKNKYLRKSIAHAIDRNGYIKEFTNNTSQKANSIYPPGIPGYSPSRSLPYDFNLQKAKKYLALAGFPEGKNLPVLKYDVRGLSNLNKKQAEFIKHNLIQIGIKVKIVYNSFNAFLEKSKKGNLQLWQGGWAMDYPDSENILQLLSSKNLAHGPNDSMYSNPKFDTLFEKIKIMPNGPKKFTLMNQIEDIVNEDIPWIMQHYTRSYVLYHNYLKNYRHSDVIYNTLKYIKIRP